MPGSDFRCGFAAIIGRPNVGKSTLFNALLGEHISIVSARKQTTRNCIRGILDGDGSQVVLVDTPGWQTAHGGKMNRLLRASVHQAAPDADVAVAMVEAHAEHPDDEQVMRLIPAGRPVVCVINKIDRVRNKNELLPRIERLAQGRDFEAIVPVSALKGDGTSVLADVLAGLVPASPPLFDTDSKGNLGEKFIVEEFVREKLFRHLGEELPYTVAVEMTEARREKRVLVLHATIHADQENRKRILVGKGGEMLKRVGRSARIDLERLLGTKVHLALRVTVSRSWTRNKNRMRALGVGTTH